MATKKDIEDFLAQKRIAVVGVSRNPKDFNNHVYRSLKSRGYQVYPVNPNADALEGDHSYPNVAKLPEPVDGVLLMVPPAVAQTVVRECGEAGIRRIWLHKAVGPGSLSPEAVSYCREHDISVVDGACPMMFANPVGFGHACHRWFAQLTGSAPR